MILSKINQNAISTTPFWHWVCVSTLQTHLLAVKYPSLAKNSSCMWSFTIFMFRHEQDTFNPLSYGMNAIIRIQRMPNL
uniref:Uncharacterized protein n=1 Tax=Rhizophora mucronata TaxID=61149 RepID=A0A2P2PSW5_RHIMU